MCIVQPCVQSPCNITKFRATSSSLCETTCDIACNTPCYICAVQLRATFLPSLYNYIQTRDTFVQPIYTGNECLNCVNCATLVSRMCKLIQPSHNLTQLSLCATSRMFMQPQATFMKPRLTSFVQPYEIPFMCNLTHFYAT